MKELVDCIDRNASGLIDKEEFVKALQNPEELLAKPEEKKELNRRVKIAFQKPLESFASRNDGEGPAKHGVRRRK